MAAESLIMSLIASNFPLHEWKKFETDRAGLNGYFRGGKKASKEAQTIVSALSHPEVVALLVREFNLLPEHVRVQVRTLCNEGNASGNVRKGIMRLDKALNGAILRKEEDVRMNVRVEGRDGVHYRGKRVDPAIAGAARKYGIIR